MNKIEQIKAEIERLKEINKRTLDGQLKVGCLYALNQVLSFLSTLEESEKPIDIDFEQELYKRFGQVKDFTLGMRRIAQCFYELGCRRTAEKYDEIEYNRQRAEESVPNDLEEAAEKEYPCDKSYMTPDMLDLNAHKQVAFRKGAKWQAERLLSGRPLPEDTVLFNKGVEEGRRLAEEELSNLLTIAHLQGADQMKEQMMKDAVEGFVATHLTSEGIKVTVNSGYLPKEMCIKPGDKVRVIVCKKED